MITHPVRPQGGELVINAACREGGTIRAELSDPAGHVMAGFERSNCLPFAGDAVDHVVRWQSGQPAPSGVFLRLRLYLWKSEVFSFQFR